MKGTRQRIALRIILVTALLVFGAPARAAELPIERWALDADTTILLVHEPSPLVELSILLPIGTWSPWARRYHAHDAFVAQVSDAKNMLAGEADRRSVALDATVGLRSSELRVEFLKEDRADALELLRLALHNRDYDRSTLVRQKLARGPLWTATQKEPFWRLKQAGVRMLFAPGDPRRSAYEEPDPVSTDVGALVRVRDAMLRLPGRVIALVGNLSRAEATQLCRGLLPPSVPLVGSPDPHEALAPRYLPLTGPLHDTTLTLDKLTQVYFSLSRSGLSINDPDFAKLLIADLVLGGSHSQARLYVALRLGAGDTYTPYTILPQAAEPEPYSMVAYTRTANAESTERKLREILQRLYQDGITAQEHRDAVAHLTESHKRHYQQPRARLRLALWEWSNGLPQGFYDRLMETVQRSALAEINTFVRRFYDPAQFALIKVSPPVSSPSSR